MEYRKLGQIGLDVGVIGLGTEYVYKQPRETLSAVVREAVERGVNYIDLIFSFPTFLENLGAALRGGYRERTLLAAHLGSTEKNGQYFKTRSLQRSETFFLDLLTRLGTDHVDVLFLSNISSIKDLKRVLAPGGLNDLARRLRQEGRARCIGLSTHRVEIATQAVESGQIDVLMFPINLAGNAMPGRKELQSLCARRGVGLVAMKPFGGGKLLQRARTVRVGKYQTGGEVVKTKIPSDVTPARCLSYALAQVGVCAAVPGVKDEVELAAALQTLEATEAERDFSAVLSEFGTYREGECTYCNHCLPCPVAIDVGQVNRLVDAIQGAVTAQLRAAYDALAVKTAACTECGACVERCPFGVDVMAKLRLAVELFESG